MNKTVTIFGIPNCSSVKKAQVWFNQQAQAFDFHDFKKLGVSPSTLDDWLKKVPWEILLNKKGTTWRQLDESEQHKVVDAVSAKQLMVQKPSIIKRPVVVIGEQVLVGVNPEQWSNVLNA
jgi:arsenate reductase